MRVTAFNYHLPSARIAQEPIHPRENSRLFVYDRKKKVISHDYFHNLGDYLRRGDVLVFNDTKVFPARLHGTKETGGKMEVFLLRSTRGNVWEVLLGGRVRRIGLTINFSSTLSAEVMSQHDGGIWYIRFNKSPKQVLGIADKIGSTPTPPYIKKKARLKDYQTIYAKKVGSVAAPTAGFHFSKRLLKVLKNVGVQMEYITLHVGYGTFQPVKENTVEKHKIHSEYAEVDSATAKRLLQAKKDGRRIIAVGTTTVRTLETVFMATGHKSPAYPHGGFKGWIDTFIYPGYTFRFVDAMVTNFHLPKSTLLMLVSAFIGRKKTLELYKIAIKNKYRFYSFGDGMFLK